MTKETKRNLFDRVDFQVSTCGFSSPEFRLFPFLVSEPEFVRLRKYHFGVANPVTGNALEATDQRSENRNLQHRSHLDACDQPLRSVYIRGLRPPRRIQLLPKRRSFCRFFSGSAERNRRPNRSLTNAGLRSDVTYVKGIHNVKAGVTYQQTFLTENEHIGIVDPAFYPAAAAFYNCLDANGNPIPNTPCAALLPYDLTRGGVYSRFTATPTSRRLLCTSRTRSPRAVGPSIWAYGEICITA